MPADGRESSIARAHLSVTHSLCSIAQSMLQKGKDESHEQLASTSSKAAAARHALMSTAHCVHTAHTAAAPIHTVTGGCCAAIDIWGQISGSQPPHPGFWCQLGQLHNSGNHGFKVSRACKLAPEGTSVCSLPQKM